MNWKGLAVLLPVLGLSIYKMLIFVQDPSSSLERLGIRLAGILDRIEVTKLKHTSQDMVPIIATVACGNNSKRLEELTVMLKSAVIKSDGLPVKFLIITDSLHEEVEAILNQWKAIPKYSTIFWEIRSPVYPMLSEETESMKTAFAPCATQRLFFPQTLTDYQRIIYVDNDVVFLQDPRLLWKQFENLEANQEASFGMVTESIDIYYSSYYYSPIPNPGNGLNSGVMLMQLERMRAKNWHSKMVAIYEEMKTHMAFCDQDLLNIYSYVYKQDLHYLPVSANVRPDFCLADEAMTLSNGLIMHGSRGCFHDDWQFGGSFLTNYLPNMLSWMLFKNIRLIEYAFKIRPVMEKQEVYQETYRAFRDFDMQSSSRETLKNDLEHKFELIDSSDLCHKLKSSILKQL